MHNSASKSDIDFYNRVIKDFSDQKNARGKNFDVKKWADDFGGLSSDVVDFLSNVQDGDDILEGLANSMGKTTQAISSSGKEIQLTGNKFKDFFTKTKSSFGTFGKVVGNGLKGFGKALLGSGLNVLLNAGIGAALSLAFKLYDTVAHAQDNVIEKGKEASAAIKSNYDAISNSNQWKTSNLERFTELAKGVNESGLNMSLSSDEFAEYQSLASSLADTLPNLVVGFNSLGQPIIKAATDMEQLNQAFRDNDVEKYQENISKASDVIKGFKTQYDERGSLFKDTGAKQKQDIYKYILDSYKNLDVENLESWNRSIMDGLSEKGYNLFEIDDALGEIGVKKIDDKSIAKGIDKISEAYQKGQTELEQYASSVKETLPSFFMISDEYAKLVEKSPAIDTFIQSITSGLSSDYVNENFPTTESIEQWTSSITSALGNKKVQTSIEDLFQLKQDKAKTPFKKYEKDVNSLVDAISGSIPEITSDMMKASLGIDRELTNMEAHYTKVSDEVGKEFADNLSISDLELASDIISEKDIKNAEELKQAIIEARNASQSIEANPIFDSIKVAKETRNKGDDYLDAHNYAKEAKEMYDKGLTGTDEFKATAKYFSPTGAEDATNFIENYSKATRYLTEDSSGVKNFLTDLSKKTDEAGNALASFDKETGKWSYNITDLSKAAHDMGMGFEFFMDMFGRLEDYNFSNNFFSTEEEGVEKLTDKTIKLAKAKRELAELEAKGENQTAISAKKEEIAGLEKDQQQIRNNLKQVAKQSAERINEQITASKDAYVALKEERDKILANPELFGENTEEVVAKMDEELKSLAQQGMFEIDGEMNIVNKDKVKEEIESEPVEIKATVDLTSRPEVSAEKMRKSGWEVNDDEVATVFSSGYSNESGDTTITVTPILPNGEVLTPEELDQYANEILKTGKDEKGILIKAHYGEDSIEQSNRYAEALHSVQEAFYLGDEAQKSNLNSLKDYTSWQLKALNLSDDSADSMENNLVSLMDSLGITKDSYLEFIDVMSDMNLLSSEFKIPTLEEAISANEKLKELGKTDITFDFETENFQELSSQVKNATELIKQFQSEDGTVDLSIEGAQEAVYILSSLISKKQEAGKPIIMSADTSSVDASVSSVIGKLQEFQNAYNELERLNQLKSAGVDVDTTAAQAKLDGLASEISNFDGKQAEIIATLGIDPSSSETISTSIQSITPEILAKVDPTLVDGYVAEEKKGKGTVEWDNDDSKVRAYASVTKTADGTVTWDNDTTKVKKTFTAQGAITWGNTTPLFGVVASGTMLSPAHADGTAYNVLNTVPAYANGKVSLSQNEKALVNEVGVESLIRDGRWMLIPGGAHIENLKKGDIILNASQTSDLLKSGKTAGHGKAYANGTISNIRSLASFPLNAYADGMLGGSGGFEGGAATGADKKKPSSNKKSNSKKTSSNKKSSDSSSATDEAKEFEEVLDWIEIKIDRIERKIKNLERVAGSAFETYANRSKALAEQMGEVSNEITVQQQAYERYLQQANSISLSEDYKSQVQNGTIDISTITDEDLKKNIDDYKQWYEKALDCKDAVEELTESVKELYQQAFDNVVEEFDNYISLIEHNKNIIDGYIEQDENAGYLVSTKYYDSLIALENQTLNQLTEERNRLIASLNEAVSSGNVKEYSDAWFKMQQDINDVNEAIQDSTSSLIDYKNAIQEIQWDIFDKIQDRISDINKESDFLIELMSNDKLFDDKGKITDKGKATMGLHGVNYNTYMAQADDYRKEMEKIQKELAEDPHNQTLIDRKRELLDLQREAIQSAEDEKEAIKDLVEEGIEKQLDSLQELIDKYNDALDSQKDLYDYQKEIAEKQKEIAEIEKQLAAYKGDNSEEGAAKRQELENALAESKDELAETQYEKSISEQKKLLDELYTEYETILNMRLDNIDMLISDVIANVNSESSGIKDTITSEADKVGYTITDSMNTIWGSNGISGVLTNYSNNFSSTMTGVMTAINDIKNLISKAIEASNNKSQSNISQSQNNQSQQGVEKPSPPPPAPKPTSPQGDGKPNKGDKVTFVSGNYYYDSYGTKPLGHRYQGQEVYITKINPKGSKPYHISKGNKLGDGDLGWVNLEQIKGYKTGVKSVPKSGLYWTNEDAPETIVRKKDNALLTKLNLGDTVLKNSSHNHIWEMATNPTDFIGKYMPKFSPTIPSKYVTTGNNPTEIQINIGIEKVQDYNDFVRQLQADNKFEKLVQSMTIDRIAGKGKLNKYGIKI